MPIPTNHSEAKRRVSLLLDVSAIPAQWISLQALERDNEQCVFTKKFSDKSALYLPTTSLATKQAILDAASAFPRGVTREVMQTDPFAGVGGSIECAHILSESTNQNINEQVHKSLGMLSCWFFT